VSADTPQPEITVLIAAHNEAERIEGCLHAVLEQDYPMERVEIVLVDDRSTDDTAARARRLGIERLRVLRIDEAPANLTARQAALDRGLIEARGEIVLITDAGARVPREWIRELTGHMGYRDAAVTAPVVFAGGGHFFTSIQTLDAVLTLTYYRWAARNHWHTGVLGANLALRREAYLEVGGFPAIGFAPDENIALCQALRARGWSIRYLDSPTVCNPACTRLPELMLRWRRKTRNGPAGLTLVTLGLILSNLALLGAALVLGGGWWVIVLLRYALGVVAIAGVVMQYGALNVAMAMVLFEPLMTLLGTWVYLSNLLVPRWRWAGVWYDRRGPLRRGSLSHPAA